MNSKQVQHDATVLPRIRELKAGGLSLRQIADRLQQEGVPAPRRGGRWSHKAVSRILARADLARPEEEAGPEPPTSTRPPAVSVEVTGPATPRDRQLWGWLSADAPHAGEPRDIVLDRIRDDLLEGDGPKSDRLLAALDRLAGTQVRWVKGNEEGTCAMLAGAVMKARAGRPAMLRFQFPAMLLSVLNAYRQAGRTRKTSQARVEGQMRD